MHYKIANTKIFFISASINDVKGKNGINKSLIVYGTIRLLLLLLKYSLNIQQIIH